MVKQLLAPVMAFGGRCVLAAEPLTGGRRLTTLIFHRVLAGPEPVPVYQVDADRFDRWLGALTRAFDIMSLGQAVSHLEQGSLPPRALVITFDDGYADNAEVALPLLRRHGVVATFFVSTGFLDGGCMWNDAVIHRLGTTRHDVVDLGPIGLSRMAVATPAERRQAVYAALKRIKYMEPAEREAALDALARSTGVHELPRDLMMSSAQVQELARGGMEIGGHTVNHPILSLVDDATAAREIEGGRRRLQELVDGPVDMFAYPNGVPHTDYDARHVAMVRAAGFRAAVSTARGVGAVGDDLFQLPRQMPWDPDARRLVARLALGRRERSFETVGVSAPAA